MTLHIDGVSLSHSSNNAQQMTNETGSVSASNNNVVHRTEHNLLGCQLLPTDSVTMHQFQTQHGRSSRQTTLQNDIVSASANNAVHMTGHNPQRCQLLETTSVSMSPFVTQGGGGSQQETLQTDDISWSNSIGLGLRHRHMHVGVSLQPEEDIHEEEMNLDEDQWHIEPPVSYSQHMTTFNSDSNVETSKRKVLMCIPLPSVSNLVDEQSEDSTSREPGSSTSASVTSGPSHPFSMFNPLSHLFFNNSKARKTKAVPLNCPNKRKGCKAVIVIFETPKHKSSYATAVFRHPYCLVAL